MPTIYVDETNALPKRSEKDLYRTPYPVALATVGLLHILYGNRFIRFVDPGADTGVWGQAIKEIYTDSYTIGIEIRDMPKPEFYDEWHISSFLESKNHGSAMWSQTAVIGNPPFEIAEECVEHAFSKFMMKDYGVCGMLLPGDFIFGQKRMNLFFEKYPLRFVFPYAKRIHFEGAGDRNPNNYAFYVFEKSFQVYNRPEIIWLNHGDMTYRDGKHKAGIFKDVSKKETERLSGAGEKQRS